MFLVKIKFTGLEIITLYSPVGLKFERWLLHVKTWLPIYRPVTLCFNKKSPITSLINRVNCNEFTGGKTKYRSVFSSYSKTRANKLPFVKEKRR